MPNQVRAISAKIPREHYVELRRLARESGLSLSELVRIAVDQFLHRARVLESSGFPDPVFSRWGKILNFYEVEAMVAESVLSGVRSGEGPEMTGHERSREVDEG